MFTIAPKLVEEEGDSKGTGSIRAIDSSENFG